VVETDIDRLNLLQEEQDLYNSTDPKSKDRLNEVFTRLE
jgi:hypothetical protein